MARRSVLGLAGLALWLLSSPARAQEVFSSLTSSKLESLLKDLGVEFKKVPSKTEGVVFYDYKKNNFNVRLHLYNGKDVMLDALFSAISLDKVNLWNKRAKFSRAVLDRDEKGSYTVIEFNLNLAGGVTRDTIKEFMNTFDDELAKFDRYVKAESNINDAPTEEKIYQVVSDELIEKVLGGLNLKYTKVPLPNNQGAAYQYISKGMKLTLTNWGKDLMVEARFKRLPLDKVNQYNLDHKFIRAVGYKSNQGEHTSLERNLDCTGGISETILRHFIADFDSDVESFGKFLAKIPNDV